MTSTDIIAMDTSPNEKKECTNKIDETLTGPQRTHEPPPNGGLWAWLQVLCGFFIFMNTWGVINTFGVFQSYYLATFLSSYTSFQISWIGSVQACLLFFVSMFTGPLYDLGYVRHLMVAGGFCTVLGMMMTSLCNTFWQTMLAQGVLVGIGMGFLFLCGITITGQWFSTRKALATGIEACGGAFGGVIFPVIFLRLQPTIGFGWATRVIAFVMLATATPPILLMRPLLKPTSVRSLLPTRVSFDTPFILYNLGCLFAFAGIYNISFFTPLFAREQVHASYTLSIYLIAILNAASIPGRLFLTSIGDRFGCVTAMALFSLLTAVVAYSWAAVSTVPGFIVLVVFYANMANTLSSLPGPACVSLTDNLEGLGTRMAVALVSSGVGILIGPPIGGAILNGRDGWLGLQCWSGSVVLVSGACMYASRVTKVGWGLRRAV